MQEHLLFIDPDKKTFYVPQRRTNNRGRIRLWLHRSATALAFTAWSSMMILLGMLCQQYLSLPASFWE
jgi:hypothetical protein